MNMNWFNGFLAGVFLRPLARLFGLAVIVGFIVVVTLSLYIGQVYQR